MTSPVMSLQLRCLSNDRAHVLTIKSPKGEPQAEVKLPFDALQRRAVALALEAQVYRPADWATGEGMSRFAALEELGLSNDNGFVGDMQQRIGQTLFDAFLPPGPLREALHAMLDEAAANTAARLELRLDEKSTDLWLYPWELLYEDGPRGFLFSGRTSGIARYITTNTPVPPLLSAPRLRVLFVAARPEDPSQVQLLPDREDQVIRQGLAAAKAQESITLDELPAASPASSTYELLEEELSSAKTRPIHVLHFDGHGGFGIRCTCGRLNRLGRQSCFDPDCEKSLEPDAKGYLAFERTDKGVHWVSATEFANLLKGVGIRLVVLSACKSAVAAGESVFSGVAPALIGAGIPAVVAMQYSINAAASSRFAKVFYRSLGQRSSLVTALGEVRAALFGPHQESWYRPVLYLRVDETNPEGRLFAAAEETPEPPGPNEKESTAPAVYSGVTFMKEATIRDDAKVAGRDIITNVTTAAPQREPPPTPQYEQTEDYQIDQVQEGLSALGQKHGAGDVPLEEFFPHFSQLFRRAAFQDHPCQRNERSMKLLLYVVTASDLVLREQRPTIHAHGKKGDLEAYDALCAEVRAMSKKLEAVFGDHFSLADHIQKHGKRKRSFVDALPDPVNPERCEEAEQHRAKAVELAHELFDTE